jgi:carbon monoxide dehydrogenase subunit G
VATFQNTVMIGRPIEDVHAFLAHLENAPKWNYAIVETRKVSEGPVGVGSIYHRVRSIPSRSEERLEVTAYSPPRRLEIRGRLGAVPVTAQLRPRRSPEGTRVTNEVELELRGPARLLAPVAVSRVRDAVAANLAELKKLLEESGAA